MGHTLAPIISRKMLSIEPRTLGCFRNCACGSHVRPKTSIFPPSFLFYL